MPEQNRPTEPAPGPGTDAHEKLLAEVWQSMVALVIDSRDPWRRQVVAEVGLPFSRIRVLKRVAARPLTLTEVAHAATMDAPAASVAVSDLEDAGYVTREPSPTDRRRKQVAITDAGRAALERVRSVPDPVPEVLRTAHPEQLRVLRDILGAPW